MKSLSVTIQMKGIGLYIAVVLFILLYKAVLTLKSFSVTIQMKAIDLYVPVILFIMLY